MLGEILAATLLEIPFFITFLSSSILLLTFTSRYSSRILTPISSFATQTIIGRKVFAFIASISMSPWKWWIAGKATETAGQTIAETNTTILSFKTQMVGQSISLVGSSMSVPAAFVVSYKVAQYHFFWQSYSSFTPQTPLRIIPKTIQGLLITLNPFKIARLLYLQNNALNLTLSSLDKAIKFGIRDTIEFTLEQAIPSEYKTINKCIALLATERSITKTTKVVIREYYEKNMLEQWTLSCPNLEKQIPFIISNAIYSFSLDPAFSFLEKKEDAFYKDNRMFNSNTTSPHTCLPEGLDEALKAECESIINTEYYCTVGY